MSRPASRDVVAASSGNYESEGSDLDDANGLDFNNVDDHADWETLPPGIDWPPILLVNKAQLALTVPGQYVQPHTFSKRLIKANDEITFTIEQFKPAYAIAVRRVRHLVDRTRLRADNPSASARKLQDLFEFEIQEVIDRAGTAHFQTKEQIRDQTRAKIDGQKMQFKNDPVKLQRICEKERQLGLTQAQRDAEKREKDAVKALKKGGFESERTRKKAEKRERQAARVNGNGTSMAGERDVGNVLQQLDRSAKSGEAGGTRYAAHDTDPAFSDRMTGVKEVQWEEVDDSGDEDEDEEDGGVSLDISDLVPHPGPTILPASKWYRGLSHLRPQPDPHLQPLSSLEPDPQPSVNLVATALPTQPSSNPVTTTIPTQPTKPSLQRSSAKVQDVAERWLYDYLETSTT